MSNFEAWMLVGVWFVLIVASWAWLYQWPSRIIRWWTMQKCEVCRKRTKDLFNFSVSDPVLWECLPCAGEREKREREERLKEAP